MNAYFMPALFSAKSSTGDSACRNKNRLYRAAAFCTFSLVIPNIFCYNQSASGGRGAITRKQVQDLRCTGNCNADKDQMPLRDP